MRILVTGSKGFIGKNLIVRLRELGEYKINEFTREDSIDLLPEMIGNSDVIVHLAGENRPDNESGFELVNKGLTVTLCNLINDASRKISLILASSIQAESDNPYGRSKLAAENVVMNYARETDNPVTIYRLPGVFGKWCRPNYNSVVATFCHNIANNIPIEIHNKDSEIRLVHIDDVVNEFIYTIRHVGTGLQYRDVMPCYFVKLGELADTLRSFREFQTSLQVDNVGEGFLRALYSTYISYLPENEFVTKIPVYSDERGVFAEILKTKASGQVSFFSAHPGVTRGEHYHHTKTEKFIVVKGKAKFIFRNILTDKIHEFYTSGDELQVVYTIPGWAHNISNIGNEEMIVLLWSNEVFDKNNPDTIAYKV